MSAKKRDADKAKAVRATGKRRAEPDRPPEDRGRRAETPTAEERAGTRKHARPDRGGSGPLVLVVDDFKDGRELAVETLEHAGIRTIEAGDGPEALAKAKTHRPDLILMDLSLPGLDGWEVTKRLKADAVTRQIRIIALTAHAQSDALDRARKAGADGVITKPCLPSYVVDQVREMLGMGATSPAPRAREEA